ncbi:MAG: 1-(5-phosphoribosyl)-5-[(5-phosphoribosylamino)methylideneamino] imidazole-4-carboxamide isomerase [Alphaproteobacteria bacterium MarineAlpha4_Bin2]|nr:MAG: 1-(5-phosphoribosyl)-5-[(5-phosphoribosylamino)methylideneamino] imidazole-4-carboxamide isomerase [Alphaproteobacteria bacterium MarineAlpha4_Bin2]
MILYPAIDLKDGECVRLRLGDMEQSTVFNVDPAAQAREFVNAGCEWLHIVDLNGAFAGKPVNTEAVESILAEVEVPVQLGGGIRNMAMIEAWLDRGVRRVILGTAAVKNPDLVIDACRSWPGRIAVGIDAKGGKVAVEGWAEVSELTAEAIAKRFEDAGVAAIIHTDVNRDGVLAGPNVAATSTLAADTLIPVIASGGVSSLDDLMALQQAGNIAGAISGRAIYDGRIDLGAALTSLAVA